MMSLSVNLFYFFSTFCILSAFLVITTKNPVFSVLFLIFSFVNVACLLFLFKLEFLPLTFIIVYVGAIAVLFLFVLMMLNIKLAEMRKTDNSIFFTAAILTIIFFFVYAFLMRSKLTFLDISGNDSTVFLIEYLANSLKLTDYDSTFGLYSNIKKVSIALFSKYAIAFVFSGYILLLAMVGTIILTLKKNFIAKQQNIYEQLMADFNKSIVNYTSNN
jgi:NADH:ubiquinone oxidoreductase subunit 6 (subunit J)